MSMDFIDDIPAWGIVSVIGLGVTLTCLCLRCCCNKRIIKYRHRKHIEKIVKYQEDIEMGELKRKEDLKTLRNDEKNDEKEKDTPVEKMIEEVATDTILLAEKVIPGAKAVIESGAPIVEAVAGGIEEVAHVIEVVAKNVEETKMTPPPLPSRDALVPKKKLAPVPEAMTDSPLIEQLFHRLCLRYTTQDLRLRDTQVLPDHLILLGIIISNLW